MKKFFREIFGEQQNNNSQQQFFIPSQSIQNPYQNMSTAFPNIAPTVKGPCNAGSQNEAGR